MFAKQHEMDQDLGYSMNIIEEPWSDSIVNLDLEKINLWMLEYLVYATR